MSYVKQRTQCGNKSNAQSRVRSIDIWPEEETLASIRQDQDSLGFGSRGRKENHKEGAQDWEGFQGPDKGENPGV